MKKKIIKILSIILGIMNPVDKVPNGEEVIVYVHEKFLQIGSEYYLPIGDVSFDCILEWFHGKADYFVD